MNSFEIGLLRKVSDSTGVPALRPNSCIRDLYMHPLSGTESVNDMAWTPEVQLPR